MSTPNSGSSTFESAERTEATIGSSEKLIAIV